MGHTAEEYAAHSTVAGEWDAHLQGEIGSIEGDEYFSSLCKHQREPISPVTGYHGLSHIISALRAIISHLNLLCRWP